MRITLVGVYEVMKRKRGGVGKRGALRTQNCDLRVRERLILNVCSECLSLLGASVKRVKRANQPLRPLFDTFAAKLNHGVGISAARLLVVAVPSGSRLALRPLLPTSPLVLRHGRVRPRLPRALRRAVSRVSRVHGAGRRRELAHILERRQRRAE